MRSPRFEGTDQPMCGIAGFAEGGTGSRPSPGRTDVDFRLVHGMCDVIRHRGPDDEGIGSRMQREVERLGLEDRVSFPGMVVGAEKAKLLAEFDVFVLPSADESFGIAVAEAMAAGVPVLITEHVALAADVEGAGAGLIAPRTDEGFATALRGLLSDPREARRIGSAGRTFALRNYSRSASMAALEQIYEDAVG